MVQWISGWMFAVISAIMYVRADNVPWYDAVSYTHLTLPTNAEV